MLDATLKDITSALLESDVNVKLVASLRQKVKVKVKAALETSANDKSKEINKKNMMQKVLESIKLSLSSNHFALIFQAVFDELVALVDPGVEPYKPKKGQSNVIMAVGLQVRADAFIPLSSPKLILALLRVMVKRPHVLSSLCTIRSVDSSLLLSVRIPSVPAPSTRHGSQQRKRRWHISAHTRKRIQYLSRLKA